LMGVALGGETALVVFGLIAGGGGASALVQGRRERKDRPNEIRI
jgi:hypothetical protein